jgi:hypothetical protein
MRLRWLTPAGAQALVAWALSRAFPGTTVSMVGEEDSADLRAPEGKAMLARITQLVNTVLAGVEGSPQISEQQLVDLIGAPQRRAGLHCLAARGADVAAGEPLTPPTRPLSLCRPWPVPGRQQRQALGAGPHRRHARLRGPAAVSGGARPRRRGCGSCLRC